jgi:uncharacterized membrane protein
MRPTFELKYEAKKLLARQQKNLILLALPAAVLTVISGIITWLTTRTTHEETVNDWQASIYQSGTVHFNFMRDVAGLDSSFALTILLSIIIGFLTIAVAWRVLEFRREPDAEVRPTEDLLDRLKSPDFSSIIKTGIAVWVFIALWAIIPMVAGAVVLGLGAAMRSLGMILLGVALMIAGFVLAIIKAIAYSQAYFLAHDEALRTGVPVSFTYGVHASNLLMKGHKGQYFWLELTFIGWNIATAFFFGLVSIYYIPYRQLTLAGFYEDLLKEQN